MAPRTQDLRVRFDTFELDEADARLRRDGTPVSLAPKAFAVLCTLVRQPGVLVTKNDLLDAVWGHQHVSESVLKTIISELRSALADDARQPRYIETASRRGYRFIGRPQVVVSVQNLPAVAAPKHIPLIGREDSLVRLREAWRRAQAGERQLLWVAGEPGVGKTRLIESFLSELPPGTATFGQCVEHFGEGEPYLPLLEAIKELVRREPALLPAMRSVAPTWLVQMPWLVSEADRADLHREVAGVHPDRMVREMRELMDRYTAMRPLVFVLEDLHWSDQGTLRMMEHFARRPREVRILWIATFRLTQVVAEDHPLRPLRQELKLHRLCEEILLDPFSESEVGAYLADRLPAAAIPEDFVRRLHEHTDGLPLFVANVTDALLTRAAAEGGAMDTWLAGSSSAPLPVPDSLAGVIEAQISRLPMDVQSVLEAASVCGVEFRAGIVAEMLGREASWVSDRCDDLVKRQFWLRHMDIVELPDGGFDMRYSFLHALYQHVFYNRLSMPQRVQLHRRAAKTLESVASSAQAAPPAELASHHERGHQFLPALNYYATAAEMAVGHFAPAEAINITGKALKLLERCADGPARMEAELALIHKRAVASGQLLGIGAPQTVACFERARVLCETLPETPERILLLNGLGLTRYIQGDYAQARAIAERVLAHGERYGNALLRITSFVLKGMIEALEAKHDASVESFRQGIAGCDELGEKIPRAMFVVDPLVAMRTNLALPLVYLSRPDEARAQLELARERAQRIGQPMAIMLVLWVDCLIEVRCGEPRKVLELAAAMSAHVEHCMLTQGAGPARSLRGWAMAQLGAPKDGFPEIRGGFDDHARLGMYAGNTETLGHAAEALLLAGDLAGSEAQLIEGFELARRLGEYVELPRLLLLRAKIALARGESTSAQAIMREALAESRARPSPYHALKCHVALCEHAAATRADFDELRAAYSNLTEGRDTTPARRAAALLE